jgi:hypothetical protein
MAALGIIVAFAGLGLGPLTDYSAWSGLVLTAGSAMFVLGAIEDYCLPTDPSHERHDR